MTLIAARKPFEFHGRDILTIWPFWPAPQDSLRTRLRPDLVNDVFTHINAI